MAPIISTQPINPIDIKYYNRYTYSDVSLQFPYTGFYQDITFNNIIVINAYSTNNDILEINFNNDSSVYLDNITGNYLSDVPSNLPKFTKTFIIKANEPQTIVIDKQFLFFRIKINSVDNIPPDPYNQPIRIYSATAFNNQNNVKIVGEKGVPAIVDLSGNLHTKNEDTDVILNNIYNVLKNQSGKTSIKGSANFWIDASINLIDGSNNISAICDLSSNPVKELTIYGTIDGRNSITTQFSNDGINFYDSQYTYNISRGGDFGYNITATPKYIRLKASAITTKITSYINYA